MKKSKWLQRPLWRLAGFDPFLMEYCPTLHNRVAGIGLYYLMQLLLIFVATMLTLSDLKIPGLAFLSPITALLVARLLRVAIRFVTHAQQRYNGNAFLALLLIGNLLLAILMSLPFCITMFSREIGLAFRLYAVEDMLPVAENLSEKLLGLWYAATVADERRIICWSCSTVFLLIVFCCCIPSLLIHPILKSYYATAQSLYEQHFR